LEDRDEYVAENVFWVPEDARWDKLLAAAQKPDIAKRNATIRKLWEMVKEEAVYIPLHSQVLAHGMKADIDMPVHPDNAPFFKFLK